MGLSLPHPGAPLRLSDALTGSELTSIPRGQTEQELEKEALVPVPISKLGALVGLGGCSLPLDEGPASLVRQKHRLSDILKTAGNC